MTQTTKGAFAPNPNQTQDSYTKWQKQTVLSYFKDHTTTMYKCEKDTKVSRPNICRYIAELELRGVIKRLPKSICPVSGKPAHYFHAE
uniref:hypothetical protein n=1 Tax=uncultured Dysgonomonas sp. TaxID=206096 RepID=UPI002613CE64|nr:hypothetical protein [uncultured Dysgonomonas sp.]